MYSVNEHTAKYVANTSNSNNNKNNDANFSKMKNWQIGEIKNISGSNEKRNELINSKGDSLGYTLANNSTYIYMRKITNVSFLENNNFIDNAINHTGNSNKIDIILRKGDTVHFEVKDYGEGIKKEDIPYIWERYYISRNRKNKKTVSGLGLSIAKEILMSHNARFGVESENNKGTIFWFELEESKN